MGHGAEPATPPAARIRALVAEPAAPGGVALREAAAPAPRPSQLLLDAHHVSLNHGDLRYAALVAPGTVLGWDAAGVVAQAAADGSGPAAGTRVAGFGAGAWGQRVAFDVADVAVVPDGVPLDAAAALPLAGVTALRTLRAAGPALGRRVLVTGAAGGIGRFAVQLAALGGAHVTAAVGSPQRAAGIRALGADAVVTDLGAIDAPVDVVLDTVGGPQLVAAYALLAPGGSLQSIGWSSGEPAVFAPYATFGPAKSITSFADAERVGGDLATLLALADAGRLTVEVGWRGGWERIGEATAALAARAVAGKAVLDVDPLAAR